MDILGVIVIIALIVILTRNNTEDNTLDEWGIGFLTLLMFVVGFVLLFPPN